MIKTGFTVKPNTDEQTLQHWERVVHLLEVSPVEYTEEFELVALQLAKSLMLQDIYEQSIIEHGSLIHDGNKLRVNPATVSLTATKSGINALMTHLLLSPKSQGLGKPTEDDPFADILKGIEVIE